MRKKTRLKKNKGGLCLVTFSNNADHQNVVYSMFRALHGKTEVYSFGIQNPKSSIVPHTEENYYFDCPLRPGIEKKTFRLDIIWKMAGLIRKKGISCLYFESMHLWNIFLMLFCPGVKKIVVVHDVIPHDQSKAVYLCTILSCKLADHVVIRNRKYKEDLMKNFRIKEEKITCLELWRYFPEQRPAVFSKKYLYFGRIRKYKGLDMLVDIARKTPEVTYQVVGCPDEESKTIVDALKACPNVEVVDWEVTDEEMSEFFHQAEWIVLPYSSATQSGVVVDAYKYSRPVIAFDVGAISEQVRNKETGFLVPAGDVDTFCAAIRKTMEFTYEEISDFSAKAYQFGLSRYAAEGASGCFMQLIHRVCEKKQ